MAAVSTPSAANDTLARASQPRIPRVAARASAVAAGLAVSLATAIALVALAVPLFLNPAWVSFEQERSRADAFTGYSPDELHAVSGSLLHDLVVGPGAFDATDASGRPVLDERERAHLRDVRSVFGAALVVAVASVLVLVAAAVTARRRPAFWAAVRRGASGLAVAVVVLGVVSVVAFDAAFELFHRLFFAAGSYTFDPATDRLVQLFPDQFWSETTILLGLVLLVLAWDVRRFAGRRLARLGAEEHGTDGGGVRL
jgi:integral membrane protein (TIGR01906 family)